MTIILALTYFGFVIKGTILAIVGEISLIVVRFRLLMLLDKSFKKRGGKKD